MLLHPPDNTIYISVKSNFKNARIRALRPKGRPQFSIGRDRIRMGHRLFTGQPQYFRDLLRFRT